MNMNKNLRKIAPVEYVDAYMKVQNFFFDFPTKEFSLNDLCSAIKISKSTANIVVERLIREGFLNREILGNLWRISCNQKHHYNTTRKVPYHLVMIYESGIIEAIREIVPYAKAIVLFGSYRKGDDIHESDIDIAVETIGDSEQNIVELGKLSQMGYRKDIVINVHVFSRSKISINLFANIANGIVLDGFLEARP